MGNCLNWLGSTDSTGDAGADAPRKLKVGSYMVKVVALRGQGGFSDVFEVEEISTRNKFALKSMLCQTPERLEMAKNEIKYLRMIDHPNVIKLFDSEIDDITQKVYMLLDWLPNGTLQEMVDKLKEEHKKIDEVTALQTFLGICRGVLALHKNNPPLAHRDLKPGNVIFSRNFIPVLMDFGSVGPARPVFENRKQALALQEFCEEACSMLYRAPELFDINPDSQIDERVDVWSLGCVLYTTLFKTSPFEQAYYDGSVKLAALNGKVTFPEPSGYSKEVTDLILHMMRVDPKERPFLHEVTGSIQTILQHDTEKPVL